MDADLRSPGKITLQEAMKDVVNSMYAFEVQEYIRTHPNYNLAVDPPIVFTKMGTYVKEVDVSFNVSANATTQGSATGAYRVLAQAVPQPLAGPW